MSSQNALGRWIAIWKCNSLYCNSNSVLPIDFGRCLHELISKSIKSQGCAVSNITEGTSAICRSLCIRAGQTQDYGEIDPCKPRPKFAAASDPPWGYEAQSTLGQNGHYLNSIHLIRPTCHFSTHANKGLFDLVWIVRGCFGHCYAVFLYFGTLQKIWKGPTHYGEAWREGNQFSRSPLILVKSKQLWQGSWKQRFWDLDIFWLDRPSPVFFILRSGLSSGHYKSACKPVSLHNQNILHRLVTDC